MSYSSADLKLGTTQVCPTSSRESFEVEEGGGGRRSESPRKVWLSEKYREVHATSEVPGRGRGPSHVAPLDAGMGKDCRLQPPEKTALPGSWPRGTQAGLSYGPVK